MRVSSVVSDSFCHLLLPVYSLLGSSVHWNFPDKNTHIQVHHRFLLETSPQGLNLCLLSLLNVAVLYQCTICEEALTIKPVVPNFLTISSRKVVLVLLKNVTRTSERLAVVMVNKGVRMESQFYSAADSLPALSLPVILSAYLKPFITSLTGGVRQPSPFARRLTWVSHLPAPKTPRVTTPSMELLPVHPRRSIQATSTCKAGKKHILYYLDKFELPQHGTLKHLHKSLDSSCLLQVTILNSHG